VDFSKFKTSDWLKVGGALIVAVFGFVAWSGDPTTVGGEKLPSGTCELGGCPGGPNMFDHFFTGVIPWILIVAVGVLAFLAASGIFKLPSSIPAPLVFLAASGLAAALVIIRVLIGPDVEVLNVDVEFERGFGMYIVALGAIAACAGSFLGFKESDSAS
jgi:hypothetical protein